MTGLELALSLALTADEYQKIVDTLGREPNRAELAMATERVRSRWNGTIGSAAVRSTRQSAVHSSAAAAASTHVDTERQPSARSSARSASSRLTIPPTSNTAPK